MDDKSFCIWGNLPFLKHHIGSANKLRAYILVGNLQLEGPLFVNLLKKMLCLGSQQRPVNLNLLLTGVVEGGVLFG